ncbi:8-oxo-dGTP diphosphatase MutT [bacterium]|nr:8-oxo-dGTP diphosphatase MutT [bacterium]
MAPKPIEVAAALVFHEGRLLITQRPATGHLANLWEFPGGKREPGESFEECLKREIQEELAMVIETGELLSEVRHSYPEKTVHLQFFKCRWLAGGPKAIGCQAFEWITSNELDRFPFPAADAQLLAQLSNTPDWWA